MPGVSARLPSNVCFVRTADAAGGGDERLQSARHDYYGQGSVISTGRSADHEDDGAITPHARLKAAGCLVEIIQYQARVFRSL